MSFAINDGGRSESKRPGQRNDCVVRAIAIAFDYPYDEVYDAMEEIGRKRHDGTPNRLWTAWIQEQGANVVEWDEGAPNVKQFLLEYDSGVYIVNIPGHAFAVIDGVIQDTGPISGRVKIKAAFEIP